MEPRKAWRAVPLATKLHAALLFAAFLFSLWSLSVGWKQAIVEVHSSRQTQTAITAFYMRLGSPFFAYETPVLGPPWSIPFELPVYQWVAAKASLCLGLPLEQAGRLVARLFFYLGLLPLFFLCRRFEMSRENFFIAGSFYLLCPFFLFWSRTFMMESTAIFFALAYLAAVAEANAQRKWPCYGLALAFGVLAAAIKITTFAAFGVAAGILTFADLWKRNGKNFRAWLCGTNWLALFCFAIAPFLAALAWTRFSDLQKSLNPLAHFIRSDSLKDWNFGNLEQRLNHDLWYMIFRKHLHGAIGHRTTWILSLLLIWFTSKRRRIQYFAATLLFLLPPLLFTNLYMVHDYYAVANAFFMVAALSICVVGLLEAPDRRAHFAGYGLLALSLVLTVRFYLDQPYHTQLGENEPPRDITEKVKSLVPENEAILIYGFDWHPMLAYYSERRTIMNREHFPMHSPEMQASLRALGEMKIGAVLICDVDRDKPELLADIRSVLSIGAEPAFRNWCDIYIRPR